MALATDAEDQKEGTSSSNISVSIDESSPFPGAVRYACGVALDSGSALIFGGYENMNQKDKKNSSKVWFYSSSINQYLEMKPLPFACSGLSAATTPDHRVVLIHGKKMVIYTPFTKQQDHEIEDLPFSVGSGASLVFDGDQNLHILGGSSNETQHRMIAWSKDKADRRVINVGNLPNRCKYSGVVYLENKLYVMGSHEAKKRDSLWIYSIKDKSWKNGADLPMQRDGFGCHLVNGDREIIVIGHRYGANDSDVIFLTPKT